MLERIRNIFARSKPVATKPITEDEARRLYEQRERQRKNPHLYTTTTQRVDPDGTLVTFERVTRLQRNALTKLQELHTREYTVEHSVYCTWNPQSDICKAIEYHEAEIGKVRLTFVRNYRQMREYETTNQLKEQ